MKCLGKVDIEVSFASAMMMKYKQLGEDKGSNMDESEEIRAYFALGKDSYVPLSEKNEVKDSEKRCESTYEQSKKKPQAVGKVDKSAAVYPNVSISSEMLNRVWLYNGKIYAENRNDYGEEQIHLLILDCVDKEKSKFDKLKDKFKLE